MPIRMVVSARNKPRAFLLLLLGCGTVMWSAWGASFSARQNVLPNVGDGAAAWGDIDGDGDPDLVLAGSTTWGEYGSTWLYRNDGAGQLLEISHALPGMTQGDMAFGDIERDGDLDLVMSGWFGDHNGGRSTVLFLNDGTGQFQPAGVDLMPMRLGVVSWADYNNDGWLDLLLAGETNTGNMVAYSTRPLTHRLNGTFRQRFFLLPRYVNSIVSHNTVCWGDYDNDGDFDLLLATSVSGTGFLFDNGGSYFESFTRSPAFDPPAWIEAVAFVDLDNDGWLDIVTAGRDPPAIYRNLRTNAFDRVTNALPAIQFLALGVGDFDHDGRADLVYAANDQASSPGGWLRNAGAVRFEAGDSDFPILTRGQILPADFDRDGRLDFLVTGRRENAGFAVLYRNEIPGSNAPPEPPGGLSARITNEWAVFSWQPATDPNQEGGLTYNLRAGTAPGLGDLVAPMSTASGVRMVPRMGNAGSRLSWSISLERLPPGTIYWSVQAVDNSFAGSTFAPDLALEIPQTLQVFVRLNTNRQVEVTLHGLPGRSYQIETSTNLTSWEIWRVTSFFLGTATYVDTESGLWGERYFRAQLLP